MDFIDEVRTRSGRFAQRIEHLDTEEASKSALVLPFLQMLGYEIFDPTEVVPEFIADVGAKKGEKVDYAVMQDGKPIILIEAKSYGHNLDDAEISQLLRYFNVTDARFGILTDGIVYRFFSDFDQPNVMDTKPFFEFNMLDFSDASVEDLKRFTKTAFDLDQIVDAARELKYMTEIKRVLAEELANPSVEFVRFVSGRIFDRLPTPRVREQLMPIVGQAFTQFINDRINIRLKSALEREEGQVSSADEGQDEQEQPEFVPAELEALNIIKAIVAGVVDVRRISLRATQRYCTVVLHNSSERKDYGVAICWLRVRNANSMKLDLKDTAPIPLEDIDSLYDCAGQIRDTVAKFTSTATPTPSGEPASLNADAEREPEA